MMRFLPSFLAVELVSTEVSQIDEKYSEAELSFLTNITTIISYNLFQMRIGHPPELAARTAIDRIVSKYPNFIGAVVALSKEGNVGAACHNLDDPFPYVVGTSEGVHIHYVECVRSDL